MTIQEELCVLFSRISQPLSRCFCESGTSYVINVRPNSNRNEIQTHKRFNRTLFILPSTGQENNNNSNNNITLLPSVNTLIARGMFCGAKYTHHTFNPIIKHLITTANKHPGKKSFIDKNMRKSHWHEALHIT